MSTTSDNPHLDAMQGRLSQECDDYGIHNVLRALAAIAADQARGEEAGSDDQRHYLALANTIEDVAQSAEQ